MPRARREDAAGVLVAEGLLGGVELPERDPSRRRLAGDGDLRRLECQLADRDVAAHREHDGPAGRRHGGDTVGERAVSRRLEVGDDIHVAAPTSGRVRAISLGAGERRKRDSLRRKARGDPRQAQTHTPGDTSHGASITLTPDFLGSKE